MRIKDSKLPGLIIFLLIGKLFTSCTPESCIGETNSFVHVSFYKSATNKLTPPDSVTVFGIGRESEKLYSRAVNLSRIDLPLDPSSDNCGYIIEINKITDTLRFIYSGYPHLISKECGITFYYILDSLRATSNAVDTILIRNKNITTFNEENIRIIYLAC
jgi:hypothetical protein